MNRFRIRPAAVAVAIALGTTGCAFAEAGEHGEARRIAEALGAKTSITQAIAAAERQTGGRAVKVDFESEDGAFTYEVKTLSNGRMTEVLVDPASGQVLRSRGEGPIASFFARRDRDEIAKLTATSTSLATAVATAEEETGGKAYQARVKDENGALQFRIAVAKNNTVQRVDIESASGKVLKVTVGKNGERDEDEE